MKKCVDCNLEMKQLESEKTDFGIWDIYECPRCKDRLKVRQDDTVNQKREEIVRALSEYDANKEKMRLFLMEHPDADLMESMSSGDLYLLDPKAITFKADNHVVITTLPKDEIDAERLRAIVLSYFRTLRKELGIKEETEKAI